MSITQHSIGSVSREQRYQGLIVEVLQEALTRVLKAAGYPEATSKNVWSSTFKGGCR